MEATTTERYRVADLASFPAGDKTILVYLKHKQMARFLRADSVDLLTQCSEFKTLDDHIRAYCSERQVSAATMHAMRRELQKLAQSGYLISQSSILEVLREPVELVSPSRIASIGFPTCDRVETLQRGMTSYIENCQRYGRTNDFVVVDDSTGPETRKAYQHMLRTLKSRYGVDVSYAGREEKRAFARKLIEEGGIPEDSVYFACVGDKEYRTTTVGANRNAFLLHTVGDLVFNADDDTLCQPCASPDIKEGLVFRSGGNPLDAWFFPDRETALQSVHFVERDVLALHEQWLGRSPQSCVASYGRECEISFDQAEPQLLRHLEMQPGKIVLTLNGTVGDCSWDNPHYHLLQRGDTLRRLTHSEQEYRSARASREMAQVASHITITEKAYPMFAMCMGLDNRELLAPFAPIGRAEDVAFGAILSKCFDATYAVHLPWMVLHAPFEPRAFSAQQMFSVGFSSLTMFCINLFDPGFASTPLERLRKLGQYLEEVGNLPKADFEEFIRLYVWRSMHAMISLLEEQIHSSGDAPPTFWVQDVRAYIALLRQNALVPIDQLYPPEIGQELTQRLLVRFGRMLEWWPTMIETARRLRLEGYRLAQPV